MKGESMGHKFILKFSSNANNGTSDGSFYLNANNDSAHSNVNISASNLSKQKTFLCPHPHGETHYYTPICVGRGIEDSGATRQ